MFVENSEMPMQNAEKLRINRDDVLTEIFGKKRLVKYADQLKSAGWHVNIPGIV